MDDCVNASIEIFTQALLTAAGCMLKTVKVRTGTQNRSSWFDAECHKKKKDVRKCLRRFRNSRDPHDLVIYQSQRKEYKCLLQKKKREEQNARVDSLPWTTQRSFGDQFASTLISNDISQEECRTLISNDILQEEWVDHFDKVFNENTTAQAENEKDYGNPGNDEESYDEILDTDISELEVKKAIQRLKSGKAAGVDGVIAEMLKAAEQEITPFQTKYLMSSSQVHSSHLSGQKRL